MPRTALTFLTILVLLPGCSQTPPSDLATKAEVATGPVRPSGDWLGQALPGAEAAIFAAGVVSTGLYERDLAVTPDGRELLWTVFAPGSQRGTIVSMRRGDDDSWSAPEIPSIFVGHSSLEPFVTPDGEWLWFASRRPLAGEEEPGDWNLWRAPREGEGWGEPEALPPPVNDDGDEYYPTLTRDGALLFTATREGGQGGEDLWLTRPNGDGWEAPIALGPAINSPGPEFNALIHPDGEWILFGSARQGDSGGGDLYVSFALRDGSWSPAENLPPPFNSPALDFCPALSPDGTLLFWSSRRESEELAAATDYATLAELLAGPGNGQSDIFWIAAERLRQVAGPE